MKIPEQLHSIGIHSWFGLCWKGGGALVAVGLVGLALEKHFHSIFLTGILIALIPVLLMLPSLLLFLVYYIITYPIRKWCSMRIWFVEKREGYASEECARLRSVLSALDGAGEKLFWW